MGSDDVLWKAYDKELLIPANQQVVSEIADEIKMIGVKAGSPTENPSPVELGQTISTKTGDTYSKWEISSQ